MVRDREPCGPPSIDTSKLGAEPETVICGGDENQPEAGVAGVNVTVGRRGWWWRRSEPGTLVRSPRHVAGAVDDLHDDADLLVGDAGGNGQRPDERAAAGAEIERLPITAGLVQGDDAVDDRTRRWR